MAIEIKPSKRGSLHKYLGVPQGSKIPVSKLSIKENDSPAIRKKKQFAINARKWKHADGGKIQTEYLNADLNSPSIKPTRTNIQQFLLNVAGKWENNKPQLLKDIPMTDLVIGPILDYISGKSDVPPMPIGNIKQVEQSIVAPLTAARNKATRMLSQEAKFSESNKIYAKDLYENIGDRFHVDNAANWGHSPKSLGVKTGNEAVLFKDAPLTPAQQKYVAAHEVDHLYSNEAKEANDWLSAFNTSKFKGRYLRGRPIYEEINNTGKDVIDITLSKGASTLSPGHANEIRARAGQLKDFIAYKKGINPSKDFNITKTDLNYAIKNFSKETGLDNNMSEMLNALKDKSKFLDNMNKYPLITIPAIVGASNMNKKVYGGRVHHAYGSKINTTWNGGDVATAGLDTASGALGGAATGAMLGSVVPGLGTAVGGVVGGLVGLGKGLLGSSAKAKQRAQLKEQNRQQIIANMDQRTQSDTAEFSGFNANTRPVSFYMQGGRMFANGGVMNGMTPMSHDTELAVGPKHEQGGISAGPNDEVEGGETMKQQGNETLVFSDRLTLPGNKVKFADASKPLMMFKGQLEKKFASNEKDIMQQRKVIDKPTATQLTIGTAKRRAMISSQKSDQILAQIGMLDSELNNMFKTQEQLNGNAEQEQKAYGGRIKHWDGNIINSLPANKLTIPGMSASASTMQLKDMGFRPQSKNYDRGSGFNFNPGQLGLQAGADVLDTISASITSNQMSNLPLPVKSLTRAPRFNTYVDNSKDISSIDTSVAETMKFIKDNTRNPAVRRASMMNILNQANKAKSTSFFNKSAMERELENKNVQLAFDTGRENANTTYENSMMQYQSNIAGLTRQSQITSNLADKITGIGVMNAQKESNDVGFAAILAQFPEGVRKRVLQSIQQGKSKGSALRNAYAA